MKERQFVFFLHLIQKERFDSTCYFFSRRLPFQCTWRQHLLTLNFPNGCRPNGHCSRLETMRQCNVEHSTVNILLWYLWNMEVIQVPYKDSRYSTLDTYVSSIGKTARDLEKPHCAKPWTAVQHVTCFTCPSSAWSTFIFALIRIVTQGTFSFCALRQMDVPQCVKHPCTHSSTEYLPLTYNSFYHPHT